MTIHAQPTSAAAPQRPADPAGTGGKRSTRRALLFLLVVIAPTLLISTPLLGDAIFDAEDGHALFADLLRSASYGLRDYERAAFIVRSDDGSVRCEIWPVDSLRDAAAFRGAIPAGTLAIVHTHPLAWPHPSTHDIQEARRLQIPIYVLTARDVYKVRPESDLPDTLVHGRTWFKAAQHSHATCALLH